MWVLLRYHGNNLFVDSLLLVVNKVFLVKNKKIYIYVCVCVLRDRRFSPSLSGNSHLKLGSRSDNRGEILGNIVQYDALAPRSEVLRSIGRFHSRDQ